MTSLKNLKGFQDIMNLNLLFSISFILYFLFPKTNAQSAPQTPPPSVKKAIDKLLNPEKGPSALEKSCYKISNELKNYVLSHCINEAEFKSLLDSKISEEKLKQNISKYDTPDKIDEFIINTIVYLIKFPSSNKFPERLWKLSAIVELHERKAVSKLTNKPLFPALINACSLLPPDNTYNIEARFLAARHYGRLGKKIKQENIIREVLKRQGLSDEVYFTCWKELGFINELSKNYNKALEHYSVSDEQIDKFPEYIDLRIRSILLNLEIDRTDEAIKIINTLATISPEKRKLYSANLIAEELILLNQNKSSLSDYWKHSNIWWKKWLSLKKSLLPEDKLPEVRVIDFNKITEINRNLNLAISTNNKREFYANLDLLLHGLRWSPALLSDAGTALCFLVPQIEKETNSKIHDLIINICRESISEPAQYARRSKLYRSISHSSINEHDKAIDIIKGFIKSSEVSDETTETIVRLWAHIAINENKDTSGPEKELVKLLNQQTPLKNRSQTTLYLSQIFKKNENYDQEKELLLKETQNPKILENKETLQIFISRLKELNNGVVNNEEFSLAVSLWTKQNSPRWLELILTEGLKDDRLNGNKPETIINNPRNSDFTQEEILKLKLLIAESTKFDRSLREQAFQQAFSEIYLYENKHSSSRKILKSVLKDERFPYQLCQSLLLFVMDDALSKGRIRDLTYVLTHPYIDRNNPMIKNAIESYGRFSATNLHDLKSIEECYIDIKNNIKSGSSFAVIAKLYETCLELGAVDLAKKISQEANNWKTPIQLQRRKSIISNAFQESLKRLEPNIKFGKKIKSLAKNFIDQPDDSDSFLITDIKKGTNLKRLTEKTAYKWLSHRALHKSFIESSPRFWFDLAELMPRNEKQVQFSFLLIESLLQSEINDLEKSFSLFSSPSIIDTDNLALREKLFELFEKYKDKNKAPNSHAAMIITMTQSGKIRDGANIDIDKDWNDLNHPMLKDIQIPTKINYFIARNKIDTLKETLDELDSDTLLSPEYIDVFLPALYKTQQKNKLNKAIEIAEKKVEKDFSKTLRSLDFQSIRFIFKFQQLTKINKEITKKWFQQIDGQIKSERDSYSLKILEAEYQNNWEEVAKWAGKAVEEYPTYYNYYRPLGIALEKLGKKEASIKALQVYVKYSKDETTWKDAAKLLEKLKSD